MLPELLAPAGDGKSLKAAILAGADAVYIGLSRFNARLRTRNTSVDELRDLVRIAHGHKVRVYVTLNVLLAENELDEALRLGLEAVNAGADALIIQDTGLLALFHTLYPAIEIHASTQCTSHNSTQLRFLASLGVRQVNLSRELSLSEIRRLVPTAKALGLKLEVFVHGAYCISFSGQCQLSGLESGHCSNRGSCIQSCRRLYRQGKQSIAALNLKDNNALPLIDALLDLEVDSLKIEGRRKGWQYVHTVVKAWRQALEKPEDRDVAANAMTTVFNRGFDPGYLVGTRQRSMFTSAEGDESRQYAGTVANYHADSRILNIAECPVSLQAGQILTCMDQERHVANLIVEGPARNGAWIVRIDGLLKDHIRPGMLLLAAAALAEGLESAIETLDASLAELRVLASGQAGSVLETCWRESATGKEAHVRGTVVLQTASQHGLDVPALMRQWNRLGDSGHYLAEIDTTNLQPGLFVPISELNAIRRAAQAALFPPIPLPEASWRNLPFPASPAQLPVRAGNIATLALADSPASMELLAQSGQAGALALEMPVLDGPLMAHYLESLLALRKKHPDLTIGPWFGPIIMEAALPAATRILEAAPWELVVCENTSIGVLALERSIPWLAGPGLNICNSLALEACVAKGAWGAILSTELSVDQALCLREILGQRYPTGSPTRPRILARIAGPQIAMASRQCLIRNVKDCGKESCDDWCLEHCDKSVEIVGEGGQPYRLIKVPGQYGRMIARTALCARQAWSRLRPTMDGCVYDFRLTKLASIQDVVTAFEALDQAASPHSPDAEGMWNRGLAD